MLTQTNQISSSSGGSQPSALISFVSLVLDAASFSRVRRHKHYFKRAKR